MIGLAMAIDEYVPKTMPMSNAKEKPRKTCPPKITIARTDKNTRPDVMIVRESV